MLTLPEYLQTLLVYKSILEMVRQMALEVHSVALSQATVHAFECTEIKVSLKCLSKTMK